MAEKRKSLTSADSSRRSVSKPRKGVSDPESRSWREVAELVVADRDRWKSRAEDAERRYRAREDALVLLQSELEALRDEVENRRRLEEQINTLERALSIAAEARVEERLLRQTKRLLRMAWRALPETTRERIRPQARSVLDRARGREEASESEESPGYIDQDRFVAGSPTARRPVSPKFPEVPFGVSVLIPTWNAGPSFELTLEAIRAQEGVGGIELIVIDSSSTDGTPEMAKRYGALVRSIPQEEFNHGSTRNQLAEMASNELMVMTVQDATLIGRHALRDLVRYLVDDDRCAAVSARQIPRTDADLFAAFAYKTHELAMELDGDRVTATAGATMLHSLPLMKRRRVGGIDNVCCALRRSAWESMRYRPLAFAEDLELGQRLIEAGWIVAHSYRVAVAHSHRRTADIHLKRHFVDRLTVAQVLNDPSIDQAGLGSTAQVAAACRKVHHLVDGLLQEGPLGLEEALAKVRTVLDPSIEPMKTRHRLRNSELLAIDRLLAPAAASRLRDETYQNVRRSYHAYFLQPHLEEFVAANAAAPSEDVEDFLVRVIGALAGTVFGNAAAEHGIDDSLLEPLAWGV